MWYPAQASAHCSGSILSKGKLYQFTNAPCYQDRNWGSSFPLWWTWIVSNHFKNNPGTALAVGGGRPKYFDTHFPLQGVDVGLKHKGVVYDFRPNDLDNVKINISFGKWEVTANNSTNKVEISAFAPKEKFMDLVFTTPTGELFHDYETLSGEVTVKLYKRESFQWKLIDTLYSDAAGIEYGEPGNEKSLHKFFNSEKHLQ
jgi:tocopherol cyclase